MFGIGAGIDAIEETRGAGGCVRTGHMAMAPLDRQNVRALRQTTLDMLAADQARRARHCGARSPEAGRSSTIEQT